MNTQSDKRELLKDKADALTETEAAEVLEYITIMEAMNRRATVPERFYRVLAADFFTARSRKRSRAQRH